MTEKVEIGDATLYCGDCLEILPGLSDIDHVITDAPYEAQAHTKARRQLTQGQDGGRGRRVVELPIDFGCMTEDLRRKVSQAIHELKPAWSLVFCQVEGVHAWREAFSMAMYKRTGIWVKPDGAPQFTGDRPGMGYESIVMHWHRNGRSKWNGGGKHGVYTSSKSDPGFGHGGLKNEHPTKKPQRLMTELIADFTNHGETVLDCFMGSGSTGVACVELGRRFVGIELEKRYFDAACERIERAYAQGRLFV